MSMSKWGWGRGGIFFSLLFFPLALTQVSADMLGTCPGVDCDIETITRKTEGQWLKETDSE